MDLNEKDKIETALLRQRRNLILTSMFMLVFDFADVSISKVSLLGTDLIVGSPSALNTVFWTIWTYFLLRYFQYWKRFIKHKHLDNFRLLVIQSMSKSFLTKDTANNLEEIRDRISEPRLLGLRVRYKVSHYSPKNPFATGDIEESSNILVFGYHWIIHALKVVISETYISEYYLPFILAIIAFLYVALPRVLDALINFFAL